jgi:hypothetical protein
MTGPILHEKCTEGGKTMSGNNDRNRVHPESRGVLNRLLAITRYSLASYLAYAPPWARRGEEPLLEAVRQIATAQGAETVRVGRLLVRRYDHAESGRFPARFAEYNDLSLGYLAQRLVEQERLMIDQFRSCAAQLSGDPEAERIAEEGLAREARHLDILTRLSTQARAGGAG